MNWHNSQQRFSTVFHNAVNIIKIATFFFLIILYLPVVFSFHMKVNHFFMKDTNAACCMQYSTTNALGHNVILTAILSWHLKVIKHRKEHHLFFFSTLNTGGWFHTTTAPAIANASFIVYQERLYLSRQSQVSF